MSEGKKKKKKLNGTGASGSHLYDLFHAFLCSKFGDLSPWKGKNPFKKSEDWQVVHQNHLGGKLMKYADGEQLLQCCFDGSFSKAVLAKNKQGLPLSCSVTSDYLIKQICL